MNTNLPPSLGIDKVFREASRPVTLVLPPGAAPPVSAAITVYFGSVVQAFDIPVTLAGLAVSWTFTVAQLRLMENKKAKFTLTLNDNIVAGSPITPVIDFAIPDEDEIIVNLTGFGDTRVVFTGDYESIQKQIAKAQALANQVEETFQKIKDTSIPSKYQGSWKVNANVPNLSALTLNNTSDKGKYWVVPPEGEGSSSLDGTLRAYKNNDWVAWNGTTWDYYKNGVTDGSITKPKLTLSLQQAIPHLVEVLGGKYPMWWNLEQLLLILHHDKQGVVYGRFNMDRSFVPDNSLTSRIRDGVFGSYDDQFLPPGAKRPIRWDPVTKKMDLCVDSTGLVYGRFDLSRSVIPNRNQWTGKKVVWMGTSIPWEFQPNSYPDQIGRMLGCTMYNTAISGSTIMFWPPNSTGDVNQQAGKPGLSGTFSEIIGAGFSQNNSYQNRFSPYDVDAAVVDHGHNDTTFLSTSAGMKYGNVYTSTPDRLGNYLSTDKGTLWGAYNTLLTAMLTEKPNVTPILGTPTSLFMLGGVQPQMSQFELAHETILEIAHYWGVPVIDWSNKVGLGRKVMSERNKTHDGVHPNQKSVDRIAYMGYHEMLGIR